MRIVPSGCVAPAQAVVDDEEDAADDTLVVHPWHPVGEQEKGKIRWICASASQNNSAMAVPCAAKESHHHQMARQDLIGLEPEVLVASFSRTGNTRIIARQIRRARDADLFEIRPAEPALEDCEAIVAGAHQERDSGYKPPLSPTSP